jgi:hypothetical protein
MMRVTVAEAVRDPDDRSSMRTAAAVKGKR